MTSSNIDLSEENHVITVAGIQGSQSGQWECRASNRAGSTSASLSVPVPGMYVCVCVCVCVCTGS